MIDSLKRLLRALLDGTVVPFVGYVAQRIPGATVIRELERRTAGECADYVQAKMPGALHFERKRDLWDHALAKREPLGMVAEFGVWNGRSINHIAKRVAPALVHGFDSFEGLREDWSGWELPKGKFDRKGRMPGVEPNVRLVKGWFNETLPAFLSSQARRFSFIHIDCDTYEASKEVLDQVGPWIAAGTVIVFDEYFGYRGWRLGEFKAWQDFVRSRGIDYDYVAFSLQSVSIRVTRVGSAPVA
jgi:hypothetical protein